MRISANILAFAVAAALLASAAAGCKYAQTYPPLPGPSLAPTFAPGVVTEYPVPTANATPFGIAEGQDGNMWFTELDGNKVGRVTPSGSINEIVLPTGGSAPEDIIKGPAGNRDVWFVESGSSKIGAINVDTLALTEYTSGITPGAGPSGLALDSSGNIWFAEFTAGQVAKITTGGFVTEYPVATTFPGSTPDAVAVTSDGRIWFLDPGLNAVGYLTFPGPTVNEVAIPTAGSGPEFATVGPDGNVWFTEGLSGNIGKVITSTSPPQIVEYTTPSNAQVPTGPFGITVSPEDNDIWFAELGAGQVGRITTAGAITEWGIPGSGTTAADVAPGPDTSGGPPNDLWFTDNGLTGIGTNQVGKINLGAVPASGSRKPLSELKSLRTRRIPIHGPLMRLH